MNIYVPKTQSLILPIKKMYVMFPLYIVSRDQDFLTLMWISRGHGRGCKLALYKIANHLQFQCYKNDAKQQNFDKIAKSMQVILSGGYIGVP